MSWLEWAIPVVAGALIGYVTNALAIKMLFRPLTEKRIFGLRVPFTPGIIPRQRDKLAGNIADTVSQDLLTPELVETRLRDPEFLSIAERAIDGYFASLLDTELRAIARGPGTSAFEALLADSFRGMVDSDRFAATLGDLFADLVGTVGELPLDRVLKRADARGVLDRLLDWLAKDGKDRFKAAYAAARQGAVGAKAEELPEGTADFAARAARDLYPALFRYLLAFLEDAGTRQILAEWGRNLVKMVLARLNAFQRFFVTAAQYDKTLDESMPDLVRDIVASIRTSGSRPDADEQVSRFVGSLVDRGGGKGPALIAGPAAEDGRVLDLIDVACEFLASAGVRDQLGAKLGALIAEQEEKPVSEVFEAVAGIPAARLASLLTEAVLGFLRARGAGGDLLARAGERFLAARPGMRVGELFPIAAGRRREWSALLTGALTGIVAEKAGEILRAVDVRKLVYERVNSLDVAEVEKIILSVMNKQLKWINVIGGVLGGIIGLVQYLLPY